MAGENFVVRRIATILTLLCVAVVAITFAAVVSPALRERIGLSSLQPPAYSIGASFDLPEKLYSATALTLFVFIRHDCSACQAAKPAVARIASQLAQRSVPTLLVVSTSSPESADADYASEAGLPRSQLVRLKLSDSSLHVVPTLVLVNQQGKVVYSTEGSPSDIQEQELLAAATPKTSGR